MEINLIGTSDAYKAGVLAAFLTGQAVAIVTQENVFNGVISSLRDGILGVRYVVMDDELQTPSTITRKVLIENVLGVYVLG